MAMNQEYLNGVADYGASLVTHVGLANGGVEITGGTYARQSITWGTAVDGNISATNEPTFDVPGGDTTVSQVQFFSGSDGAATLYGTTSVTAETFAGDGTYTLSSATINHNAV